MYAAYAPWRGLAQGMPFVIILDIRYICPFLELSNGGLWKLSGYHRHNMKCMMNIAPDAADRIGTIIGCLACARAIKADQDPSFLLGEGCIGLA